MTTNFWSFIQNLYEAKYQLLIIKSKGKALKQCNDYEAFVDYKNDMGDIYENSKE